MKKIIINGKNGGEVLVDDDDYDWLSKYHWLSQRMGVGKYYAGRSKMEKGKRKKTFMHKQIMNPPVGFVVDHIDGNPFNNQRNNLRIVTCSQNLMNAGRRNFTNRNSKYKGVSKWSSNFSGKGKRYEGWKASCYKDGKAFVKSYKTERAAAIGYNELAIKHHGEYAKLNIIEDEEN